MPEKQPRMLLQDAIKSIVVLIDDLEARAEDGKDIAASNIWEITSQLHLRVVELLLASGGIGDAARSASASAVNHLPE